jgi:TolB-like protein
MRWRGWPMGAKVSLIALAAMILLASLAGWRIGSSTHNQRRHNIESLAVLPMENLSGDPAQDYFADGMTDQLITNLGQLSSLRVISRTSAMQYRGVHKPLPQIARELNVDAIVEGTVVRYGGRVRIAAQLIQASEDRHLWAQSFEGEVKDVLMLQHEISRAIANQVRLTLTPQEQIRPGIDRPLNPEAYEAYLRGEYYLNRFTPESIHQAAGLFQQAIEKDPLGLIVNNSLCQVLVFARRYDEALVQCKANLDLDSGSARPWWLLGEIYAAKGMESEAVSSFLEALRHGGASSTMMAAVEAGGRKGGTRGYWQALIQFIPENLSAGNVGPFEAAATYLYAGDAAKAMPWLEKAVEARSFGVSFLVADPAFDSLRSDPRFIALLRKMGLAQGKPENS